MPCWWVNGAEGTNTDSLLPRVFRPIERGPLILTPIARFLAKGDAGVLYYKCGQRAHKCREGARLRRPFALVRTTAIGRSCAADGRHRRPGGTRPLCRRRARTHVARVIVAAYNPPHASLFPSPTRTPLARHHHHHHSVSLARPPATTRCIYCASPKRCPFALTRHHYQTFNKESL